MLILGIETSCDDTAVSVVEDGTRVLSSIVSSQDFIHVEYGGVVPELASRRHIEMIVPVTEEALKTAGISSGDIQGIGVTQGPGLVGSLLVGISFAKAVSYAKAVPFVGVGHLAAHALSAFLFDENTGDAAPPEFPFVALIVSGGHTSLMLFKDFMEYEYLGQTKDDAAGEAFDKVAKLLGLGFPGGPGIERSARHGDPNVFKFTRPYISKESLDFSFSGLKTAVLNIVKGLDNSPLFQGGAGMRLDEKSINDISAGFQEVVVDVLKTKAMRALKKTGAKTLIAAGGVACNQRLRQGLKDMCEEQGAKLFIPLPRYCSDNGAMVATAAYHLLKKGQSAGLDMNSRPNISDCA
ncbi:MAG: tRNA (adenosine(37)-N6)-threonylcarbamoyltransferase complex transferase subunit TsaD [Deltaproteobacteria bacterium]|nr:tRNA (adenosine(37)-N6)-threonylcarbamoyltransferase complex transferase subunit TsaD [Deltaproteobacteria bacterium]